jgi:hypothetical protein
MKLGDTTRKYKLYRAAYGLAQSLRQEEGKMVVKDGGITLAIAIGMDMAE